MAHYQLYSTPEAIREKQPLQNQKGTCWITCDGRIDNFDELLTALASHVSFQEAPTDGELFLAAYDTWGVECLSRIVGDFAFALWDNEQRLLFCARDPFCMRPFFYYFDGKRFLFASQIRQIFFDPHVPLRLNDTFIYAFLCGWSWNWEQTIYRNIRRLPGGHYLLLRSTAPIIRRYWDVDPKREIHYKDSREYDEHYRQLFRQAVHSRLRSVGPVGISLSGGVDSSVITCVANEIQRKEGIPSQGIRLFTYFYGRHRKKCDESHYASEVAQACGLSLTNISADSFRAYEGIVQQSLSFDEPDQSAVFYKLMDALAAAAQSENCRVLLWGHGADAFLDGSITYLVSYLRKLKLISLARDLRRWHHYTGFTYLKLIHRYLFRPLVYPRYWMEVSDNRPPWISRKIWRKYTKMPKSKFWQPPSITNPMVRQWYEFGLQTRRCHSWLDNQILLKHQVESRCPFFDHRLVEYLLRVPVYQKIRPGIRKFLSYRAFQDIVPKPILERYDHINPFAFVIESLRHEWPDIRKALSSTLPYLNNYIDEQEFLKELKRVRHGAPEQEPTAEAVVLLALWLRGIDSSCVTERR